MENFLEIYFAMISMFLVFGATMTSAKQHLTLTTTELVNYTDGLDAGSLEFRKESLIYVPFSGFITKHRIIIEQRIGPNGGGAWFAGIAHIEGNASNKWSINTEDNFAKILSRAQTTGNDAFGIMAERLPMVCQLAYVNEEDIIVREKDIFEPVNAGVNINVVTEFATNSALASGQWTVKHKIDFVLGALPTREWDVNSDRNQKRCEVMLFSAEPVLNVTPHAWIPPSDGRIGNVRMTTFDELDQDEYVYFGRGVPPELRADDVTDTAGQWLNENSHYFVGLESIHQDYTASASYVIMNYDRRMTFVHRGEPLAFGSKGGSGGIMAEFDFILDFQNSYEITHKMDLANITDGSTVPIILPFDIYLETVEVDAVLEDTLVSKGFLYVFAVKHNEVQTFFATDEPLSGLYGKPNNAGHALSKIGNGELLDAVPYASPAGVPTTVSSFETVGDFFPAGSLIYIYIKDSDAVVLDDVEATVNIHGRVAMKSNDFGSNILDGRYTIREENVNSLVDQED